MYLFAQGTALRYSAPDDFSVSIQRLFIRGIVPPEPPYEITAGAKPLENWIKKAFFSFQESNPEVKGKSVWYSICFSGSLKVPDSLPFTLAELPGSKRLSLVWAKLIFGKQRGAGTGGREQKEVGGKSRNSRTRA